MHRPASSDPAEITGRLWSGFSGRLGFDVGANCGQSLPLMTARFAQVVAFEPAGESWEILRRDYGGADRVRLVNAAVSDTGGETELYETPGNLAQGQLISPGHHAFTRECQPAPRAVPCMTLDEAAAKYGMPDFVKIDTEGHELHVLRGAAAVLETGAAWLIEFHSPAMHNECEGILRRAGHLVETVRHPHYPPGTEDWFNHGWLKAMPAREQAGRGEELKLGNIAVMTTALKRPEYLKRTLESWQAARGIDKVHSLTVALGYDETAFPAMISLITGASAQGLPVRICPDSTAARRSNGMGRAIAEAVSHIFALDPAVEFVVMGEEDITVSDDVLELMTWGAERFADDKRVLLVNGHDEGGQGWNAPGMGALNGDADQWAVRLDQSFNPWCWGTWRDRWTGVLEPAWDYEVNSGGRLDSGHDWQIATRIIPRGKYMCVTPDASRSQNIGQHGGWSADPAKFEATLAASFREHREPGEYVLRAAGEAAA